MPVRLARSRRAPRPSVTKRDLVPDLGIAAGTVAATALLQWTLLPLLDGKPQLVLFAVVAGALTAWRGFGPGILASSLGTSVGSLLYIQPFSDGRPGSVPIETALLLSSSLVICWLIYRLKVEQETVADVHERRNDALAFVSHELRQPLSMVYLAAGMLAKDASEETRERVSQLIVSSATRLSRFVEDLVDVTRLQGNGFRIDPVPLRLQDVILAAVQTSLPAITQRQQRLEVAVPMEPPLRVSGDAGRLQQVMANLLSNACRYSPEGAEIAVSARKVHNVAIVTVRDSGVGIARDMLERIFDPFVREFDGRADGLGIGLTLARRLVTLHGGRIHARSDGPGRGSEFTIELPLLSHADRERASSMTRLDDDSSSSPRRAPDSSAVRKDTPWKL